MPQYADYNSQFNVKGGLYVADTSLHAGPYCGLFAHTDTVIATMTCAAWTGTLTSITIPAGTFFPFPGLGASALTLASGTCTLVNV